MSRKCLVVALLCGSLLFGTALAEAKRVVSVPIDQGEATVSWLTGVAQVLEKGQWHPLQLKDILGAGDQVRTAKGARLELLLPDQSRMRFAGDTAFRIDRLEGGRAEAPRNVRVHIALGRTWSNVTQALGMKGNFEQSCDQAITGVRGTVYRMDVEQDRSALVRVYDGTVAVTGGRPQEGKPQVGPPTRVEGPRPIPGPHKVTMEEWTVLIQAMQQVRIGADGMPEKPRDFTEEEDRDEWVDWNKARDRER
jgi:hypothetical protein